MFAAQGLAGFGLLAGGLALARLAARIGLRAAFVHLHLHLHALALALAQVLAQAFAHVLELARHLGAGGRELHLQLSAFLAHHDLDAAERGLPDADDATVLATMSADPILIERPLVETEKGARLCRPQDVVREIL